MQKISIPSTELELTFSRSSGAGGQNVNKVNSKVTLHWNLMESAVVSEEVKVRFLEKFSHIVNMEGYVVLIAQAHRSQKDNVDEVMEKLYSYIYRAMIKPKVRKKTKPKKSAVESRLKSKKKHGETKKLRRKDY